MRKLLSSPVLVCASPDYLKRAGDPRKAADLTRHACLALLTMERDMQDEWQFAKSDAREKIKFAPTLTAYGEELREAALAGCGIVRAPCLPCGRRVALRRAGASPARLGMSRRPADHCDLSQDETDALASHRIRGNILRRSSNVTIHPARA